MLQPLAEGDERMFLLAHGLKLHEFYSKQLSTPSCQWRNDSNKDMIMVQFHCFNHTLEFE